jgi:hypothetical protein
VRLSHYPYSQSSSLFPSSSRSPGVSRTFVWTSPLPYTALQSPHLRRKDSISLAGALFLPGIDGFLSFGLKLPWYPPPSTSYGVPRAAQDIENDALPRKWLRQHLSLEDSSSRLMSARSHFPRCGWIRRSILDVY